MKQRTYIVAWIFMIYTFYSNVIMYKNLLFYYSGPLLYLMPNTLLMGLKWISWIFLIKKKIWAWYALIVIYSISLPNSLYNLYSSLNMGMRIGTSVFHLSMVVLPVIFLLVDRPGMWKKRFAEIQ